MKIVIIGTSWISESFKKACDIAGGIECIGVYSRKYETGKAFCEKTGIKQVFTSLVDVANSDADAVYIASPNSCHYEQSKQILESSKHVLCEKPICVKLSEFEELSNIAKKKNLVFLQALMMLYSPNFLLLKDSLETIGKITSAHLDFSQLSSKYQSYIDGKNPNVFNPEMQGGSLYDLGVYSVSLCVALFGKPRAIMSSENRLENGVDGSGTAVMKYDSFDVTLTYSKTGQSRTVSQILGEEGTVTIASVSKLCGVYRYDRKGNAVCVADDISQELAMSYEAESFRKAVENESLPSGFIDSCFSVSKDTVEAIETIKNSKNNRIFYLADH